MTGRVPERSEPAGSAPRAQASLAPLDPRAASEFLALRWVATPGLEWTPGWLPVRPTAGTGARCAVTCASQVEQALRDALASLRPSETALFLSGGIDSAILAGLVPPGVKAYTIRFDAPGAVDESLQAARFAQATGLQHEVVTVSWNDHERFGDALVGRKRAPLHPVEVGLFKAASRAAADGRRTVIVGNGADSTFGGLDKLLGRDWTFDEFVARYTFVEPAAVLREPVPVTHVFEPYRTGRGVDVCGFLKVVHGQGVTQAFEHAVHAAGCEMRAPYEHLELAVPLDLARIRAGASKYVLREVYASVYPGLAPPEKIAFARPLDQWLSNAPRPVSRLLRADLDMTRLSGEQKWLVLGLARLEFLAGGLNA